MRSTKKLGGAVVLEAMANGLPCIVTDFGGIGEYVTEETGIKIPMRSREFLVATMANELEKLSLYVGNERAVRAEDLELLIPEARRRGVFEFSDALAHGDRVRALDILDTLAETGVSWPMQVNLIAGLFLRWRLALRSTA